MVHAVSGDSVPQAQIVRGQTKNRSGKGSHRAAVLVAVIKIPEIAHGRVTIADVAGARAGQDALGGSGFGAKHKIVVAEVELLQEQRIDRKAMAIPAPAGRKLLHEGSADGTNAEIRREL